jgi:hypothetical protein
MLKRLGSSLSLNPRLLILAWSLTIYTPYDLGGLLTSKGGLWLSDNRLLKSQAQLLECPAISLRVCSALNPASLLPIEDSPITHSCEEILAECCSAKPDLLDQPLPDPRLHPFHGWELISPRGN